MNEMWLPWQLTPPRLMSSGLEPLISVRRFGSLHVTSNPRKRVHWPSTAKRVCALGSAARQSRVARWPGAWRTVMGAASVPLRRLVNPPR